MPHRTGNLALIYLIFYFLGGENFKWEARKFHLYFNTLLNEIKQILNKQGRPPVLLISSQAPKSSKWPLSVYKTPTTLAYVNITFSLTLDNMGYYADGKLDFFSSLLRPPLLYTYDLYSRKSGLKSQLVTTIVIFSWYFSSSPGKC
jgi:hypothetical protein